MESFARRGIRTTVAVAGLAALGVGLAAPAFALPSAPDVGGVGNTRTAPDATTTGVTRATDTLAALPDTFAFTPPAVDSAQADAAPSPSAAEDDTAATDSTQAEPEATDSADATDTTDADTTDADSAQAGPSQASPANVPGGVLPTIPGSPVGAQTNPQVGGIDPGSALQGLDSGNLF
jgi:hypothetical protein